VVAIAKATTTTALTSSVNPAVKGQGITFTATVSAAPSVLTPTGTVTFRSGGNALCTNVALTAATANCTTSTLAIGSTSISATYTATANFVGSSAAPLVQQVTQIRTTTSLTSTINPTVTGQATVLSVTVAAVPPGAGAPTGNVTIFDGTTALATLALSGGTASTSRTFTVGTHALTATYTGATNYLTSTSSVGSQIVSSAATSVLLKTNSASVAAGRNVTFTATVRAVSPGSGTPNGTVTFFDGSTTLGTLVLGGAGTAAFTTNALGRGTHTVTARYNGSAAYLIATSAAVTQRIT